MPLIKTVWYQHKNRHRDYCNRIERPEINPCLCAQSIFDKRSTSILWSRDGLFNKWCWQNWTDWYVQKNETRTTYTMQKNKLQLNKRLKYKL